MSEIGNALYQTARPYLSVLIPFLKDDPSPLIDRLVQEAGLASEVEIILLDDGTRSEELTKKLLERIHSASLPAKLITLDQNIGRAIGRNRLAQEARGSYLLFLDADMLPDSGDFMSRWLGFARNTSPDAAFGGLSLLQAPTDRHYAVHRAMAAKSDCVAARHRQSQPEKHLFTSNLLIRREVYQAYPFDSDFTGWGWEDVEWAMRVSKAYRIHHPDIPATHTGLDTVATLKKKYAQSAANFSRLAELHPEFVQQYPSYKVAKLIRRLGLTAAVEKTASAIADLERLPIGMRAMALRFYRAAQYAGALNI